MKKYYFVLILFCIAFLNCNAQFSVIKSGELSSFDGKIYPNFENYNIRSVVNDYKKTEKYEQRFDFAAENLRINQTYDEAANETKRWFQNINLEYSKYDSSGIAIDAKIIKAYDSLGVTYDVFEDYERGEGDSAGSEIFTTYQSYKTLKKADVLLKAYFAENQETIFAGRSEENNYTFFVSNLEALENIQCLTCGNNFIIVNIDVLDLSSLKAIYKYPDLYTVEEGINKYLEQNKQIKIKMTIAPSYNNDGINSNYPDKITLLALTKIVTKEKMITITK